MVFKKPSASLPKQYGHPAIFMFLYLPFGIFFGFIGVTMGFLLTNAGVSLAGVATIVSLPFLPNMLKFLWAPLVDTKLTVKKWYLIANIGTAAGIFITCLLPFNNQTLVPLRVIILLTGLANSIVAMSTESLIAQNVPEEEKGQAGGWLQAGNLGGFGLGGGAGIWLAEKLADKWMAGAVIAVICLLCQFGLLKLTEGFSFSREKKYLKTITNLGKAIWMILKSQRGFLALLMLFLPIGSAAATSLWSSVYKDWNATPGEVALVVGALGGILSAVGCLIGGWICDRMDRKKAYIFYGLFQVVCALSMAFCPRTEWMFVIWTSLYGVSNGLTMAGFSGIVFEAIGKTGAATKYNVFASIGNIPLYYMIFVDELAHRKWGDTGMLITESAITVLAASLFTFIFLILKNTKPETQHNQFPNTQEIKVLGSI